MAKLSVEDFEWGDTLGEGSFGRVVRATLKSTGQQLAMKIVNKAMVIKLNKISSVKAERDILNRVKHPFIIELKCTFQDEESLYFGLELAQKGELFHYLKYGRCTVEASQFYAAEIVSALEYLHSQSIIHRDLKPENILITEGMHIKLTDFGTAKTVEGESGSRSTFVGTPQYVAPETLRASETSIASDLWSFGCVLFQMLTGHPPFEAESEYLIFQKILDVKYEFPDDFPSEEARDLIQRLLVADPGARLGIDGYAHLKQHAFFAGVDWESLWDQTPPPLHPPEVREVHDRATGAADEPDSRLAPLLMEGERVIFTGLVVKRRKMTAKKRQLILTDFPRLFYIQPETSEQKGEIPWVSELWVKVKNDRQFFVQVPGRRYVLEDLEDRARDWAHAINRVKAGV